MIRVICPDVHGAYADKQAVDAFVGDLKFLAPKEIVLLGDFIDVSGAFSTHPMNYAEERYYSYEQDCEAAAKILDRIQDAAPGAEIHYIFGNHEQRIQRWAARNFAHARDAEAANSVYCPSKKLELKRRGVRWYEPNKKYGAVTVPGTIQLGSCLFLHGYRAGAGATAAHLNDLGHNLVHGHCHRAASVIKRTTATGGETGAWCPGTLSELQPLYMHTAVSTWSHGFGVQLVDRGGKFLHLQIPIVKGKSMLRPFIDNFQPRRAMGGGK